MPPKSRHRNRGSRSFLSNDLLRSIARGRSYQTVDASVSNSDFRSQSSLSCDPNAQCQPQNSAVNNLHHGLSVSSNATVSASYHDVGTGNRPRTPGTTSDGVSRHRKRKRLSWLSNPWSRVSKDGKQRSLTAIPPATSMSLISESSISSPVLTSTTNARLADTEKVHYSEVLFPISSPPEDHSRNDSILGADESSTIHGADNISSWTSSVRSIRAKLGHSRRASTSALMSSWSRRPYNRWEPAGSSSISSHRKARMAVRGKLQQLGERLHVLPIEAGNAVVDNRDVVKAEGIEAHHPDEASPTPTPTPTPRATTFLPGLHSDSTTDLLRGSLSRSFASAVDKLDLRSSPTLVHHSPSMSTLRKAKTIIGLKEKYDSDGKVSSRSKTNSSKDVRTDMSKLSRYENKTRTFDSPNPREVPQTWTDRQVRKPGVIGRDNHPDPLRSHPNVMSFASPPGQSQPPITPDLRITPTLDKDNVVDDEEEEEEDTHALPEAVIYSPSTGNLSQYTRTPTPIAKKAESNLIKQRLPEETPTKKPTFGRIKKSVSGFFTKSASKIRLTSNPPTRKTKNQEESEQQSADEQQFASPAGVQVPERATHDYQPFTPSPLRKSSRADVSEVGQANRERATTLPSINQIPESGMKLSQSRSPTTAERPERRRAMHGYQGWLDLSD